MRKRELIDILLKAAEISGVTNLIYEELMLHLGQDSDYHVAANAYIEAVPENLARFPDGWRGRTIREVIGTVASGGKPRDVVALFPEIHDLTVSKLAIRREKDLEFLAGVVDLGLIDQVTLRERYLEAPRVTRNRISEGLKDIDEAFRRNPSGQSTREV